MSEFTACRVENKCSNCLTPERFGAKAISAVASMDSDGPSYSSIKVIGAPGMLGEAMSFEGAVQSVQVIGRDLCSVTNPDGTDKEE